MASTLAMHTASGFAAGWPIQTGRRHHPGLTEDQIYDESFLDNAWEALKQ